MPAALTLAFENPEALRTEYEATLRKDGAFVATTDTFNLRDKVNITLRFPGDSGHVVVQGEVVHVLDAAMAEAGGLDPGIGVHLVDFDAAKRKQVEDYLASATSRPKESGRRHDRARTRVTVKFASEGALTSKYANDISQGGMMIATTQPLPVGSRLKVALVHPATKEEYDLEAEVVRQLKKKGSDEWAGMGVRFTEFAGHEQDIERFVNTAHAASSAQSRGGINGRIEELGIENLVQMFVQSSREGKIILEHRDRRGVILFQNNTLVQCFVGPKDYLGLIPPEGSLIIREKALYRMITWEEGSFQYASAETQDFHDAEWSLSLDHALLEGVRHKDESKVHWERCPADTHKLYLDVEAAKKTYGALPPDVQAVIRLVNKPLRLQEVLDNLPATDLAILDAVSKLVALEVLTFK